MRRGNLLLSFILLMALSVLAGSLAYLSVSGVRNVALALKSTRALYIADAGMQKAVRELSTPVSAGGRGINWRTASFSENFSGGSYLIRIANTAIPSQIQVTSEGEFAGLHRTVSARYIVSRHLPEAFNYVFYRGNAEGSSNRLEIGRGVFSAVNILGNVYGNGNFEVKSGSKVSNGKIYVAPGRDVTGSGLYTWEVLTQTASLPAFDNSYYNSLITEYDNLIATLPSSVYNPPSQNHVMTLEGQSIAYSGMTIPNPGSLTIYGSGEIVSKGGISVRGTLRVFPASGNKIALVAADKFSIEPSSSDYVKLSPGTVLYSKNDELTVTSQSNGSIEANNVLLMSKVITNLYGSKNKIKDDSIIYVPAQAVGKSDQFDLYTYLADINLASTSNLFDGSLLCNSSNTDKIVRVQNSTINGIIFSPIAPVKLISANIKGSVVADKIVYYFNQRIVDADMEWAPDFLPVVPPNGLSVEAVSFIPSTWQEIR